MEYYNLIKLFHVICVLVSITGFVIRGLLMLFGSSWLYLKLIRILPHLVDTLLLLSAIAMVYLSDWLLLHESWLQLKLILLLLYIFLGMITLKLNVSKRAKVLSWFAAICVFSYMILVAITKSILPGITG